MLIPTTYKTKIPREWCYPIGAEIVSAALEGVPQYEFLSLHFSWINPNTKWSTRSPSRAHLASLHYTNPERTMMEHNWSLTIHAVRGEEKPLLKPPLCDQILPHFRAWLAAPRSPAWLAERQLVYALYLWDTGEVEYSQGTYSGS